jgi:glycosyltransferase involved in cell wall biosynthesis
MAKPYLSIIVPAYNEAERIPKTLLDMDRRLSGVLYSYEIIVINDGSKDNTAEVVASMAKMVKNLRLIDNKENKGKGGVVRQGMLAATGSVRLFTDADNSTPIDQFEKMMPYFHVRGSSDSSSSQLLSTKISNSLSDKSLEGKKYYDVVIGSRAMKGAVLEPPEPWYKQILGKMGNIFIQILVLPGLWDTQCGFKAFTEEAALRIFNASRTAGWGFDVEILALARRMGYRIKEVPVHWIDDTRSHVKASSYFKVLWETVAIRWRLWTNGYTI